MTDNVSTPGLTIEQKIQNRDESTGASWFWCLLFGPIWFLFIGAYKWAIISLVVNLVTAGLAFIIWPFFAYRAHREVAIAKLKEEAALNAL